VTRETYHNLCNDILHDFFNQQHFFFYCAETFLITMFVFICVFAAFGLFVLVRLEGREYFEAFVMEARFVKTLFYPVRRIGVGLT
jgi:hypothetical protein